jgi:hypothetical protein
MSLSATPADRERHVLVGGDRLGQRRLDRLADDLRVARIDFFLSFSS